MDRHNPVDRGGTQGCAHETGQGSRGSGRHAGRDSVLVLWRGSRGGLCREGVGDEWGARVAGGGAVGGGGGEDC